MKVDRVTIDRINMLHPALVREATDIYSRLLEKGITIRVTHTYRSFEEQEHLYAQGRSVKGKVVTWSRAGRSFHNYGLAIDFCLLEDDGTVTFNETDPRWMEVVSEFESRCWKWGGRFPDGYKDYPHFQKTFDMTLTQVQGYSKMGKIKNFNIPGVWQS